MPDRSFLAWPFFDDTHREFAPRLQEWAAREVRELDHADVDGTCRDMVKRLGSAGWLRHAVPAPAGESEKLDVRTLCIARETLARHDGLADFAFAMQGLGVGPVSLFGSQELRDRWLPRVASGEAIAAFALSESGAGSDVTAMTTTARRDGDHVVLDGEKTWISNAGIADFYVVFARWPEGGERSFIAVVVPADAPGFQVRERIAMSAPHPLGTIAMSDCHVPTTNIVGEPGAGMRVALGTLDVFRSTVGAAALGFARRAFDEAISWTRERQAFGRALSEHQLTQARLSEMAVLVDTSALMVYRAAWTRDAGAERITREAAMAKSYATESAQRVVDGAVQLLGGRGVVAGAVVERLYRDVRALRIYEGTTEVLSLVIASQVLRDAERQDTRAGDR